MLKALIWIVCLSPIWGTLVWEVWEGAIKPRLIADGEIEALCRAMKEEYGPNAYSHARINEDQAWRYSNSYEQGCWRRVAETLASGTEPN